MRLGRRWRYLSRLLRSRLRVQMILWLLPGSARQGGLFTGLDRPPGRWMGWQGAPAVGGAFSRRTGWLCAGWQDFSTT